MYDFCDSDKFPPRARTLRPCAPVTFLTDKNAMDSYIEISTQQLKKEDIMKFNVGTPDRILRVIAGIALIALAATGTVGVWGWIGVAPLLTGLFRFCPAYKMFGLNTCN